MNLRLTAALVVSASLLSPCLARAQTGPGPRPAPVVRSTAIPTLPPASASQALPYPAFGSPAPSVTAGTVDPNVPATLTLEQAVLIAVARSPVLASARADQALARASTALVRSGLLPNFSATLNISRNHRQAGATGAGGVTSTSGGVGSNGSGSGGSGGFSTPPPTSSAPPSAVPSGSPGPALAEQAVATAAPSPGNAAGSGGVPFIADSTSAGVTASFRQLIYDGGRIASQIRAASTNEVAAAETYRRQLQTVAFNVAQAYFSTLSGARQVAVADEVVRQDVVQENLVRAQVRAGQAARADIATTELPTAQARLALVRAQGVEISAQAALANSMGLDADTVVRPVDDNATIESTLARTIPVPTYPQAIARAFALRPDLRAIERNVDAAQYTLRAAKLGRAPQVVGVASQSVSSTDPNGGAFRNSGSIGVNLVLPIFDQGLTAAQTLQAQAGLDKANAGLASIRLGVQLNVKQALINLVTARAGLDQTQAEFNKAIQVLRSTQAQYSAGVTTLPLLLNAQVGLTQALTDQVTAIYSLRQSEQAFLYAIGANTQ